MGIADRLLDDAKSWLWIGGHAPDQGDRTPRNAALLERFAGRLPEIFEDAPAARDADDARGAGMTRRLPILLLAFVAAVGLLGAPVGPTAPTEVHAAAAPLRFTSDARYDVQPKQRRVRVIVDLRMTNPSKDTPTTAYYYDHAFVQVMAGASSFKVDGPGSPRVRVVSRRKQDVQLRIDFGRRLTSGKSADYRLTFYLKDPGGSATRDLRVGDSLVSFPVWAFATRATPDSTVTVVFPKGFDVEVEAGKIAAPTTEEDGRTIFRTGKLPKPLEFFAYLVADRPGAYRDDTVATDVLGAPVQVNVRAWQDDQPWAKRISGLLDAGLPALGTRIGLDWPEYSQPLTVQEAVSRTTGGYAGLFDPSAGKVEIAYYADDFVVLHEAAHAWFNGSLLADRWANEAFASYYATVAAADIDKKIRADELTDELEKSRIPLNAWGPVGSEDVARGGLRVRRSAGPRPGHRETGRRRGPAGRVAGRAGRRRGVSTGRRWRRGDDRDPAGLARPAGPARGADGRHVRRPVANVGGARHRPVAARRAGPDAPALRHDGGRGR